MESNTYKVSLRKAVQVEKGSYNDRNDGYNRSTFSRSKNLNSCNTKRDKVNRVKAPWKQ